MNHSCESCSAVIHAVIYAAEPREGSSVRPCVDVEWRRLPCRHARCVTPPAPAQRSRRCACARGRARRGVVRARAWRVRSASARRYARRWRRRDARLNAHGAPQSPGREHAKGQLVKRMGTNGASWNTEGTSRNTKASRGVLDHKHVRTAAAGEGRVRARSNRPNLFRGLFRHVRVSRDRFETHNTTPQESLVFMSLASVVAAETNHSAVQMRRDATRQVRAAVDAARLRMRTRATCARCE